MRPSFVSAHGGATAAASHRVPHLDSTRESPVTRSCFRRRRYARATCERKRGSDGVMVQLDDESAVGRGLSPFLFGESGTVPPGETSDWTMTGDGTELAFTESVA